MVNLSALAEDGTSLLKASNKACKSLQSISYQTTLHMGDLKVVADVIQEHAEVANVGFGTTKVLVNGAMETPLQPQKFSFSYDGEQFKFHEQGKGDIKTILQPDAMAIGRTLGFQYSLVVNPFFTLENVTDNINKAELLGETLVEGRKCHQVRIYRSIVNPATKEEKESVSDWFIDKENLLPIGYQNNSIKRSIKVQLIEKKSETVFDINDGSSNELTIRGDEPKTDGLPAIGELFPAFSLKNVSGEIKKLNDFDAEVFIVDFWGTWCGPCLLAMPDLQDLHEKYEDRKVQVIGISVHDTPGKAEKFVAKKGYNYAFLVQGDELAKKLRLDTYPTLFVLDKEGKILHAEKGRREKAMKDFEVIIEKKLKR